MIRKIIGLKKYLLSEIKIRELVHYKIDLDNIPLDTTLLNSGEDISFSYQPKASSEVNNLFQFTTKAIIEEKTACLIIKFKKQPAGYIFFNLNTGGKLLYPFVYKLRLDEKCSYIHNLYVDKQFRGRGLAKLLYLKSFEIIKNNCRYVHAITDEENFISNNLAKKLGFINIDSFALIKIFNIKLIYNTRNSFNKFLLNLINNFAYNFYKIIKLPINLFEKIDEKRQKLFFTFFLLNNPKEQNKINVAYFCRNDFHHTFVNRIFPNGYEIETKRQFFKNGLKDEVLKISDKVDLLIVEDDFKNLYKKFSSFQNIKFIPRLVLQTNRSIRKFDDSVFKDSCSIKNDFRAVKKYNYEYIFLKDIESLKFFYKDMYLPHLTSRHKFDRFVSSFNLVLESFKKGGLILLKRENRFLAGGVVELNKKEMRVKYFGVLNGDASLLKKHVLSSLYYFCFKLAKENSIELIDLGFSRGFLNDGVLRYKAKWHTQVEFSKRQKTTFLLKIANFSQPIKDFLLNNPFITLENDRTLVGNIYLDNNTLTEKEKSINRYKVGGLNKLKIIYLNGAQGPAKEETLNLQATVLKL